MNSRRTALITGASQGLGYALARSLVADDWRVVIDARHPDRLTAAARSLPGPGKVTAVCGDVADPSHRAGLVVAAGGRVDLLVHNASTLGPAPLPALADVSPAQLRSVLEVNTIAPLALTLDLLAPLTAARGAVVSLSSDAAVEHYPGWGLYGASKAALDHLTLTWAAELAEVGIYWYAIDPGDMRTAMQQAAFPGEDITDRPLPQTLVPAFRALLGRRPPSGRYRLTEPLPSVDRTTEAVAAGVR